MNLIRGTVLNGITEKDELSGGNYNVSGISFESKRSPSHPSPPIRCRNIPYPSSIVVHSLRILIAWSWRKRKFQISFMWTKKNRHSELRWDKAIEKSVSLLKRHNWIQQNQQQATIWKQSTIISLLFSIESNRWNYTNPPPQQQQQNYDNNI